MDHFDIPHRTKFQLLFAVILLSEFFYVFYKDSATNQFLSQSQSISSHVTYPNEASPHQPDIITTVNTTSQGSNHSNTTQSNETTGKTDEKQPGTSPDPTHSNTTQSNEITVKTDDRQPKTPSKTTTTSPEPSKTKPGSNDKGDHFEWPTPRPKPEPLEDLPLTPEHLFNKHTIVAPERYSNVTFKKVKALDHEGPSALLERGGLIEPKDARTVFLCGLNVTNNCHSREIAENLNETYAFCPIYSTNPGAQADFIYAPWTLLVIHEEFRPPSGRPRSNLSRTRLYSN